jgi:hypothetical protein
MCSATAIAPPTIAMLSRNCQDSDIRSLHGIKATRQPYAHLALIPVENFKASTGPANGDLREIGAALGQIVKGWECGR